MKCTLFSTNLWSQLVFLQRANFNPLTLPPKSKWIEIRPLEENKLTPRIKASSTAIKFQLLYIIVLMNKTKDLIMDNIFKVANSNTNHVFGTFQVNRAMKMQSI